MVERQNDEELTGKDRIRQIIAGLGPEERVKLWPLAQNMFGEALYPCSVVGTKNKETDLESQPPHKRLSEHVIEIFGLPELIQPWRQYTSCEKALSVIPDWDNMERQEPEFLVNLAHVLQQDAAEIYYNAVTATNNMDIKKSSEWIKAYTLELTSRLEEWLTK
jgi:hypothetical protein